MSIFKLLSVPIASLMLYSVVPTKSQSEALNVKEDIQLTTSQQDYSARGREALEEVSTLINNVGNNTNLYTNKEEYSDKINELLEILPTLAEQNEVKVGDSIDQSFLGRELQKANEEVAQLREYIENLPEYQKPMSADELSVLLSDN